MSPWALSLNCLSLRHPAHPHCGPAVNQTADKAYYYFDGYAHFAGGLACGLAGLGAGMAIGIVGDAGVRCGPVAAPRDLCRHGGGKADVTGQSRGVAA